VSQILCVHFVESNFHLRVCDSKPYRMPHSVDDQLPSLDLCLALQEPQLTIDRSKEVIVQSRFGGLAYMAVS
jgi:hypothetical protein